LGFFKISLVNYLPRLALHRDPPDLCLPVARITGVSHQCPVLEFFFFVSMVVIFLPILIYKIIVEMGLWRKIRGSLRYMYKTGP
jgi:hypothetical protein